MKFAPFEFTPRIQPTQLLSLIEFYSIFLDNVKYLNFCTLYAMLTSLLSLCMTQGEVTDNKCEDEIVEFEERELILQEVC